MKTDNTLFDEGAPVTSDGALQALVAQAEELVGLEHQIRDIEQLLKRLNSRATEIKTKTIPDQMAEIGISEFSLPNGVRLRVEDFVSGSLPKDPEKRALAIGKITDYGGEGIIRNEVTLAFDKAQHNEAVALAQDLRERGFAVTVQSGVHPQTYLAFIRERLASGEELDAEALGVFIGRKTRITGLGK